jgi:hypothetical protein
MTLAHRVEVIAEALEGKPCPKSWKATCTESLLFFRARFLCSAAHDARGHPAVSPTFDLALFRNLLHTLTYTSRGIG